MKVVLYGLALLAVFSLVGCIGPEEPIPVIATNLPAAAAHPADFMLEYRHADGSMPPPYHTEYEILLMTDGSGTVKFIPDYPGAETPIWTAPVTATASQLDQLYTLYSANLVGADLIEDDRVGGGFELLRITADGSTLDVPPLRDDTAVRPIYTLLTSLVPQAVWDDFDARKQEYDQQ